MPNHETPSRWIEHGEKLAKIETLIHELVRRVGIQNGRIGKTEDQVDALTVKQSAHDVIQIGMMRSLGSLEKGGDAMQTELSETRGSKRGIMAMVERIAMIVTLVVSCYAVFRAH